MAGIFISYRRADSDGWAGRLRDALRFRFGDLVFQDVDNIADGEIFSDVIDHALQQCQVALVVIGPNWANARDEQGQRRLDQPDDWVRTETAMVLNRKIRVIPVLVGGAKLPRADELPEELRSLTKRQAREIRSNSWDTDVALLTRHLEQIVNGDRKRPVWPYAVVPVIGAAIGIAAYFGSDSLRDSAPERPERSAAAPATPTPAPRDEPKPAPATKEPPSEPAPARAAEQPQVQAKPAPEGVTPAPERLTPAPERVTPPGRARPPSTAQASPDVPATRPSPTPKGAPATAADNTRATLVPDPPRPSRSAPVQEPRRAPPTHAESDTAAERAVPAASVAPKPAAAARTAAALPLPNRPASARELKVGDSWTYRLREARYNKNLATVTHEIGGGDSAGIRETVRLRGADGDADPSSGSSRAATQRRLSLEPRIFEQPLDGSATLFEFAPFMPAFSELQPGLRWSKIGGASSSDSVNDWRFSGKVVGRERVRVPAGTFEAIKAELEGQLDLSFPSTRDPFSETTPSYQRYSIWFVPEIGRAVKYERQTFNRGRRLLEHEQYELLSYQLK